tara:strand:+ start:285 stop:722 length:438 start_codon:yes stop_codon:yes gene_type:complete
MGQAQRRNYLGNNNWEKQRKKFAIAQCEFPEGLGMWRVLQIADKHYVCRTPLEFVSPTKLEKLVGLLRKEWHRLMAIKQSGGDVPGDIPCHREKYGITNNNKGHEQNLALADSTEVEKKGGTRPGGSSEDSNPNRQTNKIRSRLF